MLDRIPRSASLLDRCLFHDAGTVGSYNYYGFVARNGQYFIMRVKSDESEARYASHATKGYVSAWAIKDTLDYKYLFQLT